MEDKLSHHLLWERIRLGDKEAFFDLYKELYYVLVNFGIRVSSDSELASV
jgi:RNA polymerase sigma-70 factor (ECF subfamily)